MQATPTINLTTPEAEEFRGLPFLDDAPGLDASDLECFEEVRSVLEARGMLDRFGLALLHKHFRVDQGETILETTDLERRELNLATVPLDSLGPNESRPTIWRLTEEAGQNLISCRCHNTYGGHGGHA